MDSDNTGGVFTDVAQRTANDDLHQLLRRRWMWLATPLLGSVLVAALFTFVWPKTHHASALVLLDGTIAQETVASGLALDSELQGRDLSNELEIATGDVAREVVRDELGLDDDQASRLGRVSADLQADALEFVSSASSPDEAVLIANTWAEAYVQLRADEARVSTEVAISQLKNRLQELREERDGLDDALLRPEAAIEVEGAGSDLQGDKELIEARISAIIANIVQLDLASDLSIVGRARIVRRAKVPAGSATGSLPRNLAVAAALGLLGGLGLSRMADRADHTIAGPDDLRSLGVRVLGTVPASRDASLEVSLPGNIQRGAERELAAGFHHLRSSLLAISAKSELRTLLVTSPNDGEGKTTIAGGLAVAMASTGWRVLLVDLNLERPMVHKLFATDLTPGLADCLRSGQSAAELAKPHPDLGTELYGLPAGRPQESPATTLADVSRERLVSGFKDPPDLVIVDGPSVLPVADALQTAAQVDGVIVVVRHRSSTRSQVMDAVEVLDQSGATLLGVVLNQLKSDRSGRTRRF